MTDFFPRMVLQPNPTCSDRYCVIKQSEYKEKLANTVQTEQPNLPKEPEPVVHEDNIYGELGSNLYIGTVLRR